MRTTASGSVLAFLGVHEPLVDQILEHLRGTTRLPARCLVFSSNPELLAVLVSQWKGEVEVVAAIVSLPIADMTEAIELIAENEGLVPGHVLWVGRGSDLDLLPRTWRHVVIDERGGADAIAQAVALASTATAAGPSSP